MVEANKLEEMMDYIDYFYETIPNIYGGKSILVSYMDKEWKVNEELLGGPIGVVERLTELHADLGVLHHLIHSNICTKGVNYRMQLDKIYDIVGAEAVDKQAEGWESFANALKGTITDIIRRKNIGLVDEEE